MNAPTNIKWIKAEKGKEQKFTFAIFPGYEVGHAAMIALLKEPKYLKLTLEALPRKYTGVEDGEPDTKEAIAYRDFLKKSTKFDMTRTLQSLTEDEFNTLIKKMENYEGWHPWPEGEEYIPIQKIIGVKMNNHKVTSYLVLYQSELKNWHFGCVKATQLQDHKVPPIKSIGGTL